MSAEQNKGEKKKNEEIDSLLKSFLPPEQDKEEGLRKIFENKLLELGISLNKACEILDIEVRGLNGLLDGTSTMVDFASLMRLARFLDKDPNEVVKIFLGGFEKSNPLPVTEIDKRNFIIRNFDLTRLKKEGIINSTTDFSHIEKSIVSKFGYESIFEFKRTVLSPAFSANKLHKAGLMIDYWVEFGAEHLKHLRNRFEFNRKALIDFFPTIRWNSINVESGLQEVIKALFKMGISVIYQPKFSSIHVNGATIPVNNKPAIILTDQKGFYPTLWFSLAHELHHVLFDWDFIKDSGHAHVTTEDDVDLFTKENMEEKANKFARDYLFPEEKMSLVLPAINNKKFVLDFALDNHIHPSLIYAFYAKEQSDKGDKFAWARVNKLMPNIDKCKKNLPQNPLNKSAKESATINRNNFFNF